MSFCRSTEKNTAKQNEPSADRDMFLAEAFIARERITNTGNVKNLDQKRLANIRQKLRGRLF